MTLTDGRLTQAQIDYYANKISTYNANVYRSYQDYYLGRNPKIYQPPHISDPDNRIPIPIARKIVTTMKGYAYRPGYISYSDNAGFVESRLKPIFDANDEELLTAELAADVLAYGVAFEILRMDESGSNVRMYRIPVNEGIAVYDDTLEKNIIAFIHDVILEALPREIKPRIRTVYYADRYEVWQTRDGLNWQYMPDMSREHPFGMVPVIVYKGNEAELSVFAPVIPLIDELDKVISSSYADERERFAQSFLLSLLSIDTTEEDENGETDWDKLKRSGLLQNLGRGLQDGAKSVSDIVAYLTKPSRGDERSEEADRIERLIYDQAGVVNLNDESVMGNLSGKAMKVRIWAMELLAADMDGYFDRGLQRRISMIHKALKVSQDTMVTISHRRNVPEDLLEMAEAANAMMGQPIPKAKILEIAYGRDIIPEPAKTVEEYEDEGPRLPPAVDAQEDDPAEDGNDGTGPV